MDPKAAVRKFCRIVVNYIGLISSSRAGRYQDGHAPGPGRKSGKGHKTGLFFLQGSQGRGNSAADRQRGSRIAIDLHQTGTDITNRLRVGERKCNDRLLLRSSFYREIWRTIPPSYEVDLHRYLGRVGWLSRQDKAAEQQRPYGSKE